MGRKPGEEGARSSGGTTYPHPPYPYPYPSPPSISLSLSITDVYHSQLTLLLRKLSPEQAAGGTETPLQQHYSSWFTLLHTYFLHTHCTSRKKPK